MEKLGERELDILQALWKLGKTTVSNVQSALLEQGEEIAYTTIQTMLNRMERKKIVARDDSGRTHEYYALLKEPTATTNAIQKLTGRFFSGSAEELTARLIEKELTGAQLERIKMLIDSHRKGENK